MFVQDVQGSERLPIICPVMHEVVRPNVVAIFWPQTNAGTIVQPEPSFLGLLRCDFEPSRRQSRSTRLALISHPACVVWFPSSILRSLTIGTDQFTRGGSRHLPGTAFMGRTGCQDGAPEYLHVPGPGASPLRFARPLACRRAGKWCQCDQGSVCRFR